MKILLISSYLPYPLTSGGQVRLYNLLRKLAQHHSVTLICEKRSYQTKKDIEAVSQVCSKVITVDRRKQWSLSNIVRSAISQYPFLLIGHTHVQMKQLIVRELQEDYDLIHVETSYVYQNLPQTSLPVVLTEHNIEYQVYERFMQKLPPALSLLKPLLSADIRKLRHWEETFWHQANTVVAVSQQEKDIIQKITSSCAIVPNGVNLQQFSYKNMKQMFAEQERRILFIGDFNWLQNKDSAEWILKEIWPTYIAKSKEQRAKSNMKLWIVGRKIPDTIKKLAKMTEHVLIDENSPLPTEDIFHKAFALLAPIRVGGGTSYKILEAMASGTMVMTTTLGNEGINATPQKELLIGDTVEELVAALASLENRVPMMQLAKAARIFIEHQYSWDSIVQKLETVYKETVTLK